ncbi:MAG: hypothetical protein K9M98_13665 [Cephaloticoccus sp.]|nr:hypothetical protein [Cephaloticoccus sp.]
MTESTTLEQVLIYHIDKDDRLCDFNAGWSEFARANDGESVMPECVLGRSLWDFVGDAHVTQIYRQLVGRARAGHGVEFQYRCDAPDKRRLFKMTITANAEGVVQFSSRLLWEQVRMRVALLDARQPRDHHWMRSCSWCQKIKLESDRWEPVEVAVLQLNLLAGDSLPQLTHGICPDCKADMLGKFSLPMHQETE